MQNCFAVDFPADHKHCRSISKGFAACIQEINGKKTFLLEDKKQFIWRQNFLGNYFSQYIYDRIYEEPNIPRLQDTYKIKHGSVIWVPIMRQIIPDGWKKERFSPHIKDMGLTILDTPEYWKKWDSKTRGSRREKFLNEGGIIRLVSNKEYLDTFIDFPDYYHHKKITAYYYSTVSSVDGNNLRNYVAYMDNIPVAGLSCYDYLPQSSLHFVAFTRKKYYSYQAGTAIIDKWFRDSYQKGVKYIDFDHLKSESGPKSQAGYTNFKHHFMDFHYHFDAYSKVF